MVELSEDDYGDGDIPAEDLAGYNTFDLTYDPKVAERERAEMAGRRSPYDDRDRFENRADLHDTKPFERRASKSEGELVNPDGIRGKLEVVDERERRDGPGGN